MLKGQGRGNEAVFVLKIYLQHGRRVFGPQHPNIYSSLEVLENWQESLEAGL
jgi:hypothetical protein